jgi:hypothetical protein
MHTIYANNFFLMIFFHSIFIIHNIITLFFFNGYYRFYKLSEIYFYNAVFLFDLYESCPFLKL